MQEVQAPGANPQCCKLMPAHTHTGAILSRLEASPCLLPQEGMQEMQALGIVPNAETYELLLDAQGAAGDIDALRRCLEAVGAAGLRLSPAGWSRVLRHFGACGDLEVGALAGGV